jgi:hypothetical protein
VRDEQSRNREMRGHYSSLLLSGCRLAASAMLSVCGTAPQALPCVSRGRIVRRSRVAPARAASGDAQTQPVDETVLLGKTNGACHARAVLMRR